MKNLTEKFDLDNRDLVDVFDDMPLWSAPFGLRLLECVQIRKNIKALDIGFGAGFPLTELAMRLGSSSRIYGIDPWHAAIERTKRKLEIFGISNVELFETGAETIPLPDQSIDLLVSNNGINNVQDMQGVLDECGRIAKSGAQFVITVNLDKSMVEFYDLFGLVCKELGFDEAIGKMRSHIYEKRRPLDEFTAMLNDAQFDICSIKHDEFAYTFADGSALFEHFFIRLAFLESWKALLPEDQRQHVFAEIEKRFNTIAKQNGSCKLTIPFVVIDAVRR